MVPRKQGLIVNISSFGGQTYLFNVAYGIGKAALDRMSVDCGIELKKHNVACLSLMLGAVKTELTSKYITGPFENAKLKANPDSKQVGQTERNKFKLYQIYQFLINFIYFKRMYR